MASPFVLDNTLGAALVGVVLAASLHGVSVIQAYYYYTHQTDGWLIKWVVGLVMLFDTVHQALITHTIYTYTVSHWGDPEILSRLVWSLLVEVLFNGFTALLVQGFLAFRVWRLSNGRIFLTVLVISLIIAEFGCIIAFTALSLPLRTFAELAELKRLSILVNALAAAGDILIAGSLCTLLHCARTGFHRSDTMINKLMVYAVNTGLLTSFCAVGSLISIVVAGDTFLYITFFFCIGRFYTNSLLATLNARRKIRASSDGIHSTSDHVSLSLREFPKNGSVTSRRAANISIKIDTTKEFASDRSADRIDMELDDLDTPNSSVNTVNMPRRFSDRNMV